MVDGHRFHPRGDLLVGLIEPVVNHHHAFAGDVDGDRRRSRARRRRRGDPSAQLTKQRLRAGVSRVAVTVFVTPGGHVERRKTLLVLHVDPCAVVRQELDHAIGAAVGRAVESGLALVVGCVHVESQLHA